MRTFFIFAASALLLAAVTVELSTRLWPGSSLALLVIAALALLAQGYLSLRFAPATTTPVKTTGRGAGGRKDSERKESSRSQGAQRERAPARKNEGNRPQRDARNGRQENSEGQVSGEAAGEAPSGAPRESGTVKWFNRSKGFGFIIRDSGEEIFVHQRSILAEGTGENRRRPALKDGQAVTFVVANREKGLQAEEVSPA